MVSDPENENTRSQLILATALVDSGISLVPIKRDGSKTPDPTDLPREWDDQDARYKPTWNPLQERLATAEELQKWFGGSKPAGIATIGGKVSGNLEILDFDVNAADIFSAWRALVEDEAPGLVEKLNVVATPRDPAGYHVRYRCAEVVIPGNTVLAAEEYLDEAGKKKKRVFIETRGEGGYAIAPGSPDDVHENNKPYVHVAGPALTELSTLTVWEREILVRCARSFDLMPVADDKPRGKDRDGLCVGDDFDQRGPDWCEILESHGWKCVASKSSGERRWKRPGKDAPGWSATTGHCTGRDGADLLRIFNSSDPTFEDGKAYGRFRAYALLNHDSDYAAAARELAQQGYGEQREKSSNSKSREKHNYAHDSDGLTLTCLSAIRPEPVRYLIPGYKLLGKLTLLAGDGGHGKSTLTLDIAACLTTGRPCLGLKYDPPRPCEVLLISCEDDFGDTVVPRLLACGADLSKIHRVDGVKGKDGKTQPFNLACYEAMERELKQRPDVRYVAIDPCGAYVGKAGVDDHKDSELRGLLGPMSELAARRQVTIELVKHFHKGASLSAVHKVGGGVGYVNTVRASFILIPDREDDEVKLLLPLKFNPCKKPQGRRFRREELPDEERRRILDSYCQHLSQEDQTEFGNQLSRLVWIGDTDADADEEMRQQAKRGRGPSKVDNCVAWLETFLGVFAHPSDEIVAAAKLEGFTFDNVKEAKAILKVTKNLWSTAKGFQGKWWSGFGEPDGWLLRPTPTVGNTPPRTPPSPHSPDSPQTGKAQSGETGESRETGEVGEWRSPHSAEAPIPDGPEEPPPW
jgi:hypothetical protein